MEIQQECWFCIWKMRCIHLDCRPSARDNGARPAHFPVMETQGVGWGQKRKAVTHTVLGQVDFRLFDAVEPSLKPPRLLVQTD